MEGKEESEAHFDLIYARHAAEYHELVSCEDWQGNLSRTLREVTDLAGKTVVELGAGTGRLTQILAPLCGKLLAFDRSQPMLDQAASTVENSGLHNVTLGLADNRAVPLPDQSADVVIEGWSFGHTVSLAGGGWRVPAEALLAEGTRLLRKGGILILVETLGTGVRMPAAPGPVLPVFYGLLEKQLGFGARWVRTDYRFPSLAEARRLVELFFGRMVDYELADNGRVIVPECTGIWWRRR